CARDHPVQRRNWFDVW
nr:immunoglobulin heavy chain junction region [Macaca mulatta]MOW75960.1 immunoglobulin heavy chain junction region [Macaca mulatta]MOW76058.1 immunoglobulin heavy chain junction region [Macaca mulatta]MOW76722.1 immunoglobulin heavy chain junction region [Macaca mulatta]MOW77097.1 immunoglobulin heavy chain junction region [Macaca mulatta]